MHEDQYHREQREQVEDNTKRITALEKKKEKTKVDDDDKATKVEVKRKSPRNEVK